jgi:hypothetical protein
MRSASGPGAGEFEGAVQEVQVRGVTSNAFEIPGDDRIHLARRRRHALDKSNELQTLGGGPADGPVGEDQFGTHRTYLFTFLYHGNVDATNNAAERAIRLAVVARKISCGNLTERGKRTWQVLASIAATCAQQRRSFTKLIEGVLPLGSPIPSIRALSRAPPNIGRLEGFLDNRRPKTTMRSIVYRRGSTAARRRDLYAHEWRARDIEDRDHARSAIRDLRSRRRTISGAESRSLRKRTKNCKKRIRISRRSLKPLVGKRLAKRLRFVVRIASAPKCQRSQAAVQAIAVRGAPFPST